MEHIQKIAAGLEGYGIDAMLVTSQPGEFYAAGFYGEGIALVAPGEALYITDSRYIEAAQRAVTAATVVSVTPDQGYLHHINAFLDRLGIHTLGVEEDYLSLAAYRRYESALHADLVPAGRLLLDLRAAKDPEELAAMGRAQAVTDAAFSAILDFLRPGLTEAEVAARLQYEMLRRGAERMSFDPIVASGPNGSMPHAVPGARKLQRGDFVTMDFGCKVDGYCSDMTRTVALGEPTEEMEAVYAAVLAAQRAGIAAARAGVPGKTIDAAARQVLEAAGYGLYFSHSFGHSLGLEIHEGPNASAREERVMPAGAVVSAEPGVYLPGRFGVRIEDVLILREGGCEDITRSPKELIIL